MPSNERLAAVTKHVLAARGMKSESDPSATLTPQPTQQSAAEAEEGPCVRLEFGSGGVAKIVLDRPSKLNSLSLSMIYELKEKYAELRNSGVRCVILSGEGRALCVGGDVAALRDSILVGTRLHAEFFYAEYQLDYEIAVLHQQHKILQVAMWDGIVMGGGVGLSVHCPIRITTEKTIFAMPETAIGLFPDVGMTWSLSRLSGGEAVGMFLALIGQRIHAADCLFAGLATHYCPSDRLPMVEEALRNLGSDRCDDLEAVSAAIAEVIGDARPDESKAILKPNLPAIERCFGRDAPTAELMAAALSQESSEWGKSTWDIFQKRSPTSMKITLEAIRRHKTASFKEAITMEYRLSQRCMRAQSYSDFIEGVRAVVVDKDHKPVWNTLRLEDVTAESVDDFFSPFSSDHPFGELDV